MARTRTTVTLDEDVLKAVKLRAARSGMRESAVIERALRDSLLVSPLEAIWTAADKHDTLSNDEAMALALEAQTWVRDQHAQADHEAPDAA